MSSLGLPSAFGQTVLRVDQAAGGSQQDGTSWATAFTKLEDAIAAAHPTAGNVVEIWVAKGTYKPSGTDRTAAFHLKSHLIIRGGFRGDETTKNESVPYANPTVLSGDIGTQMVGAVTALNPFPTQLPSTDDAGWGDNCYNVLVGEGVTDVTLEYLTITGGSATDSSIDAADIDGYEMYSSNQAAGAKSAVKPSSTVVGGGLYFTTGSSWTVAQYGLQMFDCTFTRNRARGYGGAVGLYDGSAFMGGCSFEQNVCDGSAGAFWGLNQQSGFAQCTFTDNSSAKGGGAVKIMGVPSDRSSDADIDGFTDALRAATFAIYGVSSEDQTRDRIGGVLTAYGIYQAANVFRATEGGFFTKAAATIPNPFAKSTTQVGGVTVQDTSITPATRVLAVYALVQIGMAAADNIVKVLDYFGKLDKSSQDYQNWVSVNENFNKYATPQGLISLAVHSVINAALPGVQPDLIDAKKSSLAQYTQAGRSGFASCEFSGNQAGNEGGAIELVFNNLLVEDCRFEGNSAAEDGGAISTALWNMPQVISSVFSNNTSADGTSAIANSFNSLMMVVNCTIINNRSSHKLGKAVTATMGADVRIYNSVLWGNSNASVQSGADVEAVTEDMLDANAHKVYDGLLGERVNWLGYMDIRNSIVQSLDSLPLGTDKIAPRLAGENPSQDEINAAIAATNAADARGELESSGAVNVGAGIRQKVRDPSYGNSAQDPKFLSTPAGKPSRLSPANNAGNNQWIVWKMLNHAVEPANITDVAGSKRILNSRVDIGAYEVDGSQPDDAPLAGEAGNGSSSGTGTVFVKPAASGNGTGSSWANATGDLQGALSQAGKVVWVAAGTYKPTAGTDRGQSFSLASGVQVYGGFAGTETALEARDWRANKTIISGSIGGAGAEDNSQHLFVNTNVGNSAVMDGLYFQDAYGDGVDGGAILNVNSSPEIRNCVFQSNHARNGGAIFSSGTAAFGSTLSNCEFRGNTAELGGGAVSFDSSWIGVNLFFSANTAQTGGAVHSTGADGHIVTLTNALFTGNGATGGPGGAVWAAGLGLYVTNSTFYANTAAVDSASPAAGGAVYFDDPVEGAATLLVYNSIFYKNTATNAGTGGRDTVEKQQIFETPGGGEVVRNSLIQGLQIYAGGSNFEGDPLFLDEGTDFHVRATSFTIDAGNTAEISNQIAATDLDGNDRVINGAIDLGPYEHAAVAGNPLGKVTSSSATLERYTFAADYAAQPDDTLQWQVDRGRGEGFVALNANDPSQDALPDEYLGVNTGSLTVLSPPSGFLFRLKLVRGGVTYYSPVVRFSPTDISKGSYVYVRPVATGDGSGSGWANATSDLQAAISQHPYAEVWVQEGTYKPTSGTDRDASFSMGLGVKIYGGFRGTESVRAARDAVGRPTLISGNIGSPSDAGDNSRHLFRNGNVGGLALIDGLIFEGAYADGEDGGAILNTDSTPLIQNCVFRNNHARNGGAIRSNDTASAGIGSVLLNCRFENNTADLTGGAVSYNSSLYSENLVFDGNQAGAGGALSFDGNSDGQWFFVKNGLFFDNRALNGNGGAIFSQGLSLQIYNSTFYGNRATLASASKLGGGAIYQDYVVFNTNTVTVFNSIFYGNSAVNPGTGGLESLELQQIAVKGGGGIDASHSLIQGLDHYANIPEFANFDEDPAFVDVDRGDFRLSSSSPAINSGIASEGGSYLLATTDLGGHTRVVYDTVDLGPYEYDGPGALGRVTSSSDFSSGSLLFTKTANVATQPGDVLQWYVDRGDGHFVLLDADSVYSGVNSTTLTITAPPSSANGYVFRLQVTRGDDTLTTMASQLTIPLDRIYVDAARVNMPADGASWFTAYGDLAAALKASGPNSTVWVASGTYFPTSGSNTDAAFQMPAGVRIYGGFPSPAAGSEFVDRNPSQYPTVLSGKLNGTTSRLAYSRNVVRNTGTPGRSALLDGFVLQDSYSSLVLNDGASPTIRNCVFQDNDTSRTGDGAAISNINGANPLIAECQFLRNACSYGGALYVSGASARVENSLFAHNGASACGGAIVVERGSLDMVNCTVADNASQGVAAALYASDGVVTVNNSIFWNNKAPHTGYTAYNQAIQTAGGSLTFGYSCVEGGDSLPATNVTTNPLFDPSGGYAPAFYSPLVNAGSDAYTVSSGKDLAGNPRIHENDPDMGVYELQTDAPVVKVRLNSLPQSRVAYNIEGSADFSVTWPAGSSMNPFWTVLDANGQPLDHSRYSVINDSGSSTVRINNISVADTGIQVSFRDVTNGIYYTSPATLTVREPRIVRVNPAATGSNDGTSWANAYTDLAAALTQAQTADEIWVAGGTYTAGGESSFRLKPTVGLYGGFAGTETARSERDYVAHPTVLRPVGGNSIVYGATTDSDYPDLPSVFDGFIVENGAAGCAVNNSAASTAYRNCIFRNNAGYIGNSQSQAQYENCEFTGNTGSLFLIDRSTVSIDGGSIHDNATAVDLINSYNASVVTLSDAVVTGNTVAGALIRSSSGAQGGASLTVQRVSFRENTTGGGIIDNGSKGTCVIGSSLFAKNIGSGDFATVHNSGTLSVVLSTFADNRGGSFGGGLVSYAGSVASINGCIFWGNRGSRASAALEAQQLGDLANSGGSGEMTVKRSIIEGLTTYTDEDDGNLAYYPFFVNPAGGDYHVPSYSPAIYIGVGSDLVQLNPLDLDKVSRRYGYAAEGAYESPGLATPLLVTTWPSSVTTAETTATGFTYTGQGSKQWQYFDGTDWVNITADTSDYRVIQSEDGQTSTLHFDSPSLALNGTRYRLVITFGGGTIPSGDLVLTVNRPRTIYVNGGVAASGDGGSWAAAFKTVQEALAVTNENCEIWVQAGTYAIDTANLKWKVHLYGGFAGNETQRSQRDWTANEVTLLGNGKQIFSSFDTPADIKTSHAVLDGFTLTGVPSQAAVFLTNSEPVISNCTFRGNKCAISVSGHANPVITNCIFDSHTATVLNLDGDTETISGCTFTNNSDASPSASGSTIYVFGGSVTITDSVFTGNTPSGGVVVAWGDSDATIAANVVAGKVTTLTMSRCKITGNTAYAGILATQVLMNLDSSLIAQNTLTSEAVRGYSRSLFNLTNVTIADNTGTFECAGVQCDAGGKWNLVNSVVWGNRTSWPYAALLNPNSPSLVENVQVKLNGSSTTVRNSTIEGAYLTLGSNGNSGYDPLFVDAGALDYQLNAVSPAINAGSASGIAHGALDLASQPRIAGAAPDMGAYEFTGEAGTPVRLSSNLGARKVIVGQGTQYSVQVPAGVSVQWQVKTGGSFVDVVSGDNQVLSGNGSVLTLSNVTPSMSGYQYRFVLSGDVSYTSAGAVLTVVSKPVVYVNVNATGNHDGTSWADAYTSPWDAVFAAASPVTGGPCEVWVAQGTYVLAGNTSIPPGVELYGGFAGTESARSERDVAAHPAILTRTGTSIYAAILSDGNYSNFAQVGIVIDGFTFTGPYTGVSLQGGPAFVRNCTFTSLGGYGIVENYKIPVTIEDCTFDQIGKEGVYSGPGTTTTIRRSTFEASLTAAAVSGYPTNVTVEDSVIQDAAASGNLDATVYVGSGAAMNMTRCRVLRNHSPYAIENDGTLLVRQSLIADNFGGGVYAFYSSVATSLTSVTIAGNAGTAVRTDHSVALANSIVSGNGTLDLYGGTGVQHWDPLFSNPAAGDYTLSARSPAINAGDASAVNDGETDLAGNARSQAGAPDLGAYESASSPDPLYRGPLPASVTTTRGMDGTFSITGASGYTYTWQYYNGSEWVDIAFNSATGAWEGPAGVPLNITTVNGVSTLTITSPALSAGGSQFRVTIDGQGVTSDPLRLTVNEPEIMYVDASVAASGDGKTWGAALKTLDEALARVVPSRRVIYVAAGTYKPANNTRFEIEKRMEIYGGFPAGGGAFADRDAAVNPVILSGELGDPASTADNAFSVLYFSGLNSPVGADTILDGVTVTGGRTGISVNDGATPTLRNLTVSHNAPSGGLSVSAAGGRVENSRFLENSNTNPGGGAYIPSGAVTFSRCVFRGNTAFRGGGLYIGGGSVRLENVIVSGNKADTDGGGISAWLNSPVLVNCTVTGNFAGTQGGGIYVFNGQVAVRNSIVWANRAAEGTIEGQQLFPVGLGYAVQSTDVEGLDYFASGTGNLGAAPFFFGGIEAASAPTTTGDFHLYGDSPGVDAGDDDLLDGLSVDADDAPRSVRTVDMGAYELQGAAGDPLTITHQPADLVLPAQSGTSRFQVALAGSDYTFQWESSPNGSVFTPVVDGPDFAGAQTATLQLLRNDPALHGLVFRARITGAFGSVITSRSALLTVYPLQYYVNAAAADDTGDGYTWATAFKTLGTALAKARVNPATGVQVWVAGGAYVTSGTDTAASFPLKSNVEIYGGFAGTETDLAQRDVAAHPTVLAGIEGSAAVFASSGTDAVAGARIDGFAINTATNGVSMGQNVTLTVANCSFSGLATGIAGTVDTITVQNCQFTGLTQYGISNTYGSLSVADSLFTGNKLGIGQGEGSLSVARSAFHGNGAPDADGGGVKTSFAGASFESCLFSGNYSRSGSGLYSQDGHVTVRNCTFAGNFGEAGPGGIYFPPSVTGGTGILEVYNSILWGNATPGGTGVSAQFARGQTSGQRILANNDVQNAPADGDFNASNGNISVDPLFVAPVTASAAATTEGDYRLTSLSSAVINKGSNTHLGSSATDLAQSDRIVDTTVDLGAYEFPSVLVVVTSQPAGVTAGIGHETAVYSAASNSAEASYQWQVSYDGGNTWTDLVESSAESGVTTATLTVTGNGDYNGRLYRVKVTSPDTAEHPGVAFSDAAFYHFAIVTVSPPSGVPNATLTGTTSTISFTVAGGALPASIADGSFAIHAMQTGRLSLADGSLTGFTITGSTVSLQSAVPFKPGERVEVTTTTGVQRADGFHALPLVYQFHAANRSNGIGAFLSPAAIAGAPATATTLACGDVNGDGPVDLVIGGADGAAVWLNNGTASFASTGQALGSGVVSQVLLGSLGMTGTTGSVNKLDVVLRKSTGDVEIWRNEGNGTFTNTSTITGVGATSLGLADLNGDGALDLFIATAGADQVWFNNGAGVFSDSGQRLGSGEGLSVAIGDYNNNSLDVFTANGSGSLEIWNNNGAGHFATGPGSFDSAVSRVIAADLDKDGHPNLVTVRTNGQIRIYRQTSGGDFDYTTQTAPVGTSISDPMALSVGDLDGDGFPDLVFNSGGDAIQVWKGQGYDSFNNRMNFQQVTQQPAFSMRTAAELADLNGDGMMDSVFISASGVPMIALYVATPAAPAGLTATAISDTRIALAWTDNATTETGYSVERSPNGNNNWTVVASSLPANTASYTDTVPNASTQYYYRVRCDIGGILQSPYSNTASATTPAAVIAAADAIAMLEGGTATTLVGGASSVLANDGNPAGGTLEAAVVTSPAHGALTLNADGSFSYTPSAGFYGSDSSTYRATNPATGATATAVVSITVTRLNDAPDSLALTPAAGTHYTGQPAGEAVATLSATDPDPEDAGLLTFSLVSGDGSADNADFTIAGATLKTAAVIDASAGLTRSIRVRVTDSMGLFREQTFTVAFTQAPTAAPGSYDFDEDTPFEGHLSGAGGADALSYEIVSQPSHGTLALGSDGTYVYTPDANFHGADSFTYRVGDGTLNSAPFTVTLTVDPVDDAPALDAVAPVTTIEDTPVSFTLAGHDPEGDAITYQLASTPALGTVQIDGAVVTYTPNANVLGTETLSFTATAGGLTSAPLPVVVTVTPEPVASTVYRGLYEYTDVPASGAGDWSGVLPANISTPAHGAVTLEGSRLLYKHNGDSATSDSFTYTLTNEAGDIRHVGVQITISDRILDVTNANDSGPGSLRAAIDITNRFAADTLAPDYTTAPDWLIRIQPSVGSFGTLTTATNEGSSLGFYSYFRIAGHVTIDASAAPGYILTTGGSHGARHFLVLSGASLTLKHLVLNNGEASDRTFSPALSYGGAILNFGSFTAEDVEFRNSRAAVGAAIYNDGGTLSLTDSVFNGNFILWAGDPGGIVVSRNGSLSLSGVTFTGNSGQNGGDLSVTGDGALATVSVSDSTIGAFHLSTVNSGTLSVTGLPRALDDAVTRPVGQPVTIALATLLANDSGGPFASVSVDAVSAQGVAITRDGDNLTYAAPAGLAATDTFTYSVTTAAGLSSTATVTVSIENNPYPRGNADTLATYRGVSELIDVLANDTDDNHGTLTLSAVGAPAHGTATIENGRIRYTNDGSPSTTDTFTYSVSNGSYVTENVTVTVTVADRVLDVTSGDDSGPGTLRAALALANRYTGAGAPQWTIRILAGTDQTWTPAGATNDNYPDFRSAFKIAGNVLIDATGSPNFTLSGPDYPYGRLFLVQPGATLALKNLTLANSQATGFDPNSVTLGGAVLNRGAFSATNVSFRNNTAVRGAALYNDGGAVTLTDSVFSGNVSPYADTSFVGIVYSDNGTLNLAGGVSIDGYGSVPALFVGGGTLNHSGENHIASYQLLSGVTLVPGAPSTAGDSFSHVATTAIRIPIATLLANDPSTTGAAFTFDNFSARGVPVTRDGDFLIYNAPAAHVGDDSFTYTLTNSLGLSSTATVTIQEFHRDEDAPTVVVTPREGGGVLVTVQGDPNAMYRLYSSSDLAHWDLVNIVEGDSHNDFTPVTEIFTDWAGNATFEDLREPDPGAARFYRAETFSY